MPVSFERVTLPNGLEIVAEVDPGAHTAGCGFYVKAGARDEASKVMGVSHFLEHMMFKGTDTRSAADVDRDMIKKMTKQLKSLKERVKRGDASCEDEMYELEEKLDAANAMLKKEKEAAKKEKEAQKAMEKAAKKAKGKK